VLLFYFLATAAVVASLAVIGQRNPVYSVLSLIASFAALSGIYIQLDAPFAAVIQIIVYAGAIMVLFLFVVMLLNAPHEDTDEDLARGGSTVVAGGAAGVKVFGALLALTFVLELAWMLGGAARDEVAFPDGPVSSVAAIGRTLFTDYAFAFEVTSVLILVAMVGAVVLARRTPGDGR
jgi:NADH-quinone oxidoreductase subunit J